jgi:hypothetical protein
MAEESRFVVTTIECPHCKVKQKVHVAARTGASQMGNQYIFCIGCEQEFNILLPNKIVGGPFPA